VQQTHELRLLKCVWAETGPHMHPKPPDTMQTLLTQKSLSLTQQAKWAVTVHCCTSVKLCVAQRTTVHGDMDALQLGSRMYLVANKHTTQTWLTKESYLFPFYNKRCCCATGQ
jgi:hypothetical protein